jgi:hypothetical protein
MAIGIARLAAVPMSKIYGMDHETLRRDHPDMYEEERNPMDKNDQTGPEMRVVISCDKDGRTTIWIGRNGSELVAVSPGASSLQDRLLAAHALLATAYGDFTLPPNA